MDQPTTPNPTPTGDTTDNGGMGGGVQTPPAPEAPTEGGTGDMPGGMPGGTPPAA